MNFLLLLMAVLMTTALIFLYAEAAGRRRAEMLIETSSEETVTTPPAESQRWLVRWLARAGYRKPSAELMFLGATAALAVAAALTVLAMQRWHVVPLMVSALSGLPGGVGDILVLVARFSPYLIFIILASTPTLIVRASRRDRVQAIEQDLAPALELLATLAEAGLGFDSALNRILDSESYGRPLAQEFDIYQRDILGGINRLEALRMLGRRIKITSVSIFVSAMIQADQVGASLAETLRTQADDLRDRRKLHALLLAQALPVKLVFPLMLCFLPGIFFSTLGPVLSQLVNVADTILRR